jgi:hypothetical protein
MVRANPSHVIVDAGLTVNETCGPAALHHPRFWRRRCRRTAIVGATSFGMRGTPPSSQDARQRRDVAKMLAARFHACTLAGSPTYRRVSNLLTGDRILTTSPSNSRLSPQEKGGIARRERLTPSRRSEIAARAAKARWSREPSNVNLANIEDFQMNSDTIDAAEILITELSEQEALLSQSGVSALLSGHLGEARLIINAIEETQVLHDRAEHLKTDIAALHSVLLAAMQPDDGGSGIDSSEDFTNGGRRQDRTDPALMNAKRNKILTQLESMHHARFHRRSAAIYRTEDDQIGIVCSMSKWHAKNENYWYAYHPHQDGFLASVRRGYFVLGMMDSEAAVALPADVIRQNLGKLNTTTAPDGRSYWHIHISHSETGELVLHRAKGEPPLPLGQYTLQFA